MAARGGEVMHRLSLATLPDVPEAMRPMVDPRGMSLGIVHLGIGAFHRAHQAVYTEAAMAAADDTRWGIAGVTQRSRDVIDQLAPQDGLYTLLQRGERDAARVVGSVRQVLSAQDDPDRLVALVAAPATRVVTLTVTEKGYRHDPATGRLLTTDPEVTADAGGRAPRTVVGQLARGLQRRMRHDAGPITVVSCDNLPGNGRVLQGLLREFVALLPAQESAPLLGWLDTSVGFPCTMVDRIVPATTDADRAEVRDQLGVEDRGVVVAEPFSQWVVEDAFAADRPDWERVGVTVTVDVAPFETMKLRLLNGSHSALAYLGALAGAEYVADAVRREHMARFVRQLMDVDVTPGLVVPAGFDVEAYKLALLERFANPGLRHRTTQIAIDGSQKLPQRLLATVRDRLRAGEEPRHACLAIAAWIRYVTAARSDSGRPLPVDDPLAARFQEIAEAADRPTRLVEEMLGVRAVFGADLPDNLLFRRLLVDALERLTSRGADAAVRDLVETNVSSSATT